MRAIDTNVLVRLLVRDDAEQVQRAEAFVAKGVWISQLVLAETVWVLESVYRQRRTAIAAAVEMLLDHQDLTLQDMAVVAAALDRFQASRTVGFTDCLILEAARKAGHEPVGTFDREFGKLEGAERIDRAKA